LMKILVLLSLITLALSRRDLPEYEINLDLSAQERY